MRISDWSSDVCSSVLPQFHGRDELRRQADGSSPAGHSRCRGSAGRSQTAHAARAAKIGRASWRERVCQYGSIPVVAVSLKKKQRKLTHGHRLDDTVVIASISNTAIYKLRHENT